MGTLTFSLAQAAYSRLHLPAAVWPCSPFVARPPRNSKRITQLGKSFLWPRSAMRGPGCSVPGARLAVGGGLSVQPYKRNASSGALRLDRFAHLRDVVAGPEHLAELGHVQLVVGVVDYERAMIASAIASSSPPVPCRQPVPSQNESPLGRIPSLSPLIPPWLHATPRPRTTPTAQLLLQPAPCCGRIPQGNGSGRASSGPGALVVDVEEVWVLC